MKMSREILFKSKRTDNGEWVEGFYFCMVHDYGSHVYHFIIPLGADLNFGTPIENIQVEVDPETVCQYTDSIDIKGKKIFEHNIVEKNGAIGIVKFGKYGNGFHLGYYIDWINCPHLRNELHFWEGKVRIIGNIFDNPELIGRGKRHE